MTKCWYCGEADAMWTQGKHPECEPCASEIRQPKYEEYWAGTEAREVSF